MIPEELQNLKSDSPTNMIFKNKNEDLNFYQLSIIFLAIFIMIIFVIYKIGYFILLNKTKTPHAFENNYNNYDIIKNIKHEEKQINANDKINIEDLLISDSYSKNLEDLIINAFFYDTKKGFYIDIGNFTPNGMSATKYFYLKGWNGINIKPYNDQFKKFIKGRIKDININFEIGGKFSTKYIYHDFKENNTFYKLSEILKKYIPKNKEIQFCKINMKDDTRKILLGFDYENFAPRLFCIESNNTFDNFEYILYKNNYSYIYQYELSRYYIDNRINYLKERFYSMDEIIKIYKSKLR